MAKVTSINLTDSGGAYTTVPTVTLTGGLRKINEFKKFGNSSMSGDSAESYTFSNSYSTGNISLWVYVDSGGIPADSSTKIGLLETGSVLDTNGLRLILGIDHNGVVGVSSAVDGVLPSTFIPLIGSIDSAEPVTTSTISTADWNHLFLSSVYDSNTQYNTLRFYLNNTKTFVYNGAEVIGIFSSNQSLNIGSSVSGSRNGLTYTNLPGYYDEIYLGREGFLGSPDSASNTLFNSASGGQYSNEDLIITHLSLDVINATASATLDDDGRISQINVLNSGSGYLTAPTVIIDSSSDFSFTVGETTTITTNDGVVISGEITHYSDSDYKLHLVNIGGDDGKFHEPAVGLFVKTDNGSVVEIISVTTENNLSENEQNNDFNNLDFLDFSESNPFGDPQ